MNRHQRRQMSKLQSGSRGPLGQAAGKLQQAVQALQSLQGIDGMTQQMSDACKLVSEVHSTVAGLAGDYRQMADEVEALKLMVFEMKGEGAEQAFRAALNRLKALRPDVPPLPGNV